MIEVIYNEEDTGKLGKRLQLPKNIRQVGKPGETRKIYIEDYVVTYLNQLAMPTNPYVRGAILLGSYENVNDKGALFISGAVEAQNVEFDLDETVFTNETWTSIYKTVQTYFPELEVVGWFLSRLGFSTSLNEKIIRTHIENFSGNNMTLYMIDALDCEDTFYLYEQDMLQEQQGYYIYYEKNEEMQNYMIHQNKGCTTEAESNPFESKQEQFKEEGEVIKTPNLIKPLPKKEKKTDTVMYAASLVLIVVMLGVGISSLNHYDKLKTLENKVSNIAKVEKEETKSTTISQLPDAKEKNENNDIPVQADANKTEEPSEIAKAGKTEEVQTSSAAVVTTNQPPAATTEEIIEKKTEATTKELANATVEAANTVEYYIVQPGDTLEYICLAKYQTRSAMDTVIAANHLSDINRLYPGQQLRLPQIIVQ